MPVRLRKQTLPDGRVRFLDRMMDLDWGARTATILQANDQAIHDEIVLIRTDILTILEILLTLDLTEDQETDVEWIQDRMEGPLPSPDPYPV